MIENMERETGLEPEARRFTQSQRILSRLFSSQPVRSVSPGFRVSRRLVITRLSKKEFGGFNFTSDGQEHDEQDEAAVLRWEAGSGLL
jgi:hypothetical protein